MATMQKLKRQILGEENNAANLEYVFNLLHPHISKNILHAVLYTFPKVLTCRMCLTIKSFFSCKSFPLFLWPSRLIQGWFQKGKSDAHHF